LQQKHKAKSFVYLPEKHVILVIALYYIFKTNFSKTFTAFDAASFHEKTY